MLGPWDCSSGSNLIFAEVSSRARYGAPQVRSLRNFRVSLYRRTPRHVVDCCVAAPFLYVHIVILIRYHIKYHK